MIGLSAETEIGASAPEVWRHITDLASYGEWNSLFPAVSGDLVEGGRLSIEVYGQARPLEAWIVRLVPDQELALALEIPYGLLRPVYTQRLESLGQGWVRYVHKERYEGLLARLLAKGMRQTREPLFAETCDALRQRVMG